MSRRERELLLRPRCGVGVVWGLRRELELLLRLRRGALDMT